MIESISFLTGHLLLLVALALSAYVLGRTLSRRLRYRSAVEAAAFSLALGLGALAWLLFLLGHVGWLHLATFLGLAVVVHLAGWRVWRDLWRSLRSWEVHRSGLILLVVALLLPSALLPLYPPTEPDATAYHLPFATAYLAAHGPVFDPTLRFPILPVLSEMLFAAMIDLGGDTAAHLVHYLEMLVTAGLLLAWAGRAFSRRAGVWAAAFWLGTPLVVWMGGVAYVDLGLATFVTAALLAWERWRRSNDRALLVLAGACAGFAAGTKYLGLFFVGGLGLLVLLGVVRRRGWGSLAAFSISALAALAPWYVWLWQQTGNPLFPYYSQLFGESEWVTDIDRKRGLAGAGAGGLDAILGAARGDLERGAKGVIRFLRVPWDGLFLRNRYAYQAPPSPFLLLFLPLALPALFVSRSRRPLLWVLAYGLVWATTVRDLRFLLAVLPALAVSLLGTFDRVAGPALDRRFAERRFARRTRLRVAPAIALLLLTPGSFYALYKIQERGLPPATDAGRQEYLLRGLPGYPAIDFLNRTHGSDYTVYVLSGPSLHHHAQGRFLGARIGPYRYDDVQRAMRHSRDLERRLRSFEAGYLLILWREKRVVRLPKDQEFPRRFALEMEGDGFVLYRLVPKTGPAPMPSGSRPRSW